MRSRGGASADQLVLEQLRLQKSDGRVGKMLCSCRSRSGRTGHSPPEAAELGDGLAVVVRAPRARRGRSRRACARLPDRGRRRRGTTSRARPRPSVPRVRLMSFSFVVGGRRWRRARERGRAAQRVMAGREASVAEGGKRRPFRSGRSRSRSCSEDGSGSRRRVESGSVPHPRARSCPAAVARSSSVSIERDRREERLGVGVDRVLVERGPPARLDDQAEVHDGDPVRDVADDAEIVGDEDVREPELVLEVVEEVDDLRLDRHVERGDGLVCDDQLRVESERARDADALALPARELVRIAVDVVPARGRRPPAAAARVRESRPSSRRGGSATGRRRSARRACGDSATRTGPGRSSASRAGTASAPCVSSPVMSTPSKITFPLVGSGGARAAGRAWTCRTPTRRRSRGSRRRSTSSETPSTACRRARTRRDAGAGADGEVLHEIVRRDERDRRCRFAHAVSRRVSACSERCRKAGRTAGSR